MITDDPKHPGINQPGPDGQNLAYLVLSAEERAKGWVRPFRDRYTHVGKKPTYPLRPLTAEETANYAQYGYVAYEQYPKDRKSAAVGRFWTQKDLDGGCRQVTTMGRALSETYARDPKFYGSTYCASCGAHFPVENFVWTVDNQVVGS